MCSRGYLQLRILSVLTLEQLWSFCTKKDVLVVIRILVVAKSSSWVKTSASLTYPMSIRSQEGDSFSRTLTIAISLGFSFIRDIYAQQRFHFRCFSGRMTPSLTVRNLVYGCCDIV